MHTCTLVHVHSMYSHILTFTGSVACTILHLPSQQYEACCSHSSLTSREKSDLFHAVFLADSYSPQQAPISNASLLIQFLVLGMKFMSSSVKWKIRWNTLFFLVIDFSPVFPILMCEGQMDIWLNESLICVKDKNGKVIYHQSTYFLYLLLPFKRNDPKPSYWGLILQIIVLHSLKLGKLFEIILKN